MLNPMTRWEPGTQVRYHGSLAELHGMYAAHPCRCLRCTDDHDLPGVRFALEDVNGATVIECVRPRSITPV